MKKNYLLPYKFKKIGMALFIPFCTICLFLLFTDWELNVFQIPAITICSQELFGDFHVFQIIKTDPINEIGMLGLLLSFCFIALSKEKDEDEMTGQVRMQSFVWSFWVTAFVLAFGVLFIYGMSFLYFAFIAVFLVFFLYILKFNLAMNAIRREDHEE